MTDNKFNQLTGKLGPLAQALMLGAISAQVSVRFPAVKYAIEQNVLWEKRQVIYASRYPEKPEDYDVTLKQYQDMTLILCNRFRFTPDQAMYREIEYKDEAGRTVHIEGRWLTLKEVAEELARNPLPDIDPQDAIELGKTTVFSADQWYRGCTDRRLWE